jgi:hypothetical protein
MKGRIYGLFTLILFVALTARAQFTFTTNGDNTLTITGYSGTGGSVAIPDSIVGLPVTIIGEAAFGGCTTLTNVVIPDSVTFIEDHAFLNCYNLTNVAIGSNVASIGVWAFQECDSLTSISIPDSLTNIESGAFEPCPALTAFVVGSGNPAYVSLDGVLFDHSKNTLIQFPASKVATAFSIPDSVATIGDWAFEDCIGLTSVTIPNSVTNMGSGTFESCSGLTNVGIGENVASIGGFSFGACSGLLNVTIPESVTRLGDSAFAGCASLTNALIGNGVKCVGAYAFYQCYSLTNVLIPDGVTSIGGDAFSDCIGLTEVIIPNTVTNIGPTVFLGTGITSFYFKGNAPTHGSLTIGAGTVFYLPGTVGWNTNFAGLPTSLWTLPYPLILNSGATSGSQAGGFGFLVSWATNIPVVVEACTNLSNPLWQPLQTNSLTNGTFFFSDPEWTNYPGRFYRVTTP